MKVRFLSLAEREVEDAFAWYEEQSVGLGREFLDELDRAVRRIATFPLAATVIELGLRRCLLSRFPYGLIYGVDEDTIVVLAVAHLHREPRYWINRT